MAQGRRFALVEHTFGQLLATRGAELLVLRNQFVATVALHLEAGTVESVHRLEQLAQRLHTHAEAHVVGIGKLADSDAHHLVAVVENGTARVSGIHGGIGLYVVFAFHQLLGRRHGAFGHRKRHAVGIARHTHLAADRQRVVGRQTQVGQVREVAFGRQQGDVERGVYQHHVCQVGVPVVVVDGYVVETVHHVAVGDEQVVRLQVEAASGASGVRHLVD